VPGAWPSLKLGSVLKEAVNQERHKRYREAGGPETVGPRPARQMGQGQRKGLRLGDRNERNVHPGGRGIYGEGQNRGSRKPLHDDQSWWSSLSRSSVKTLNPVRYSCFVCDAVYGAAYPGTQGPLLQPAFMISIPSAVSTWATKAFSWNIALSQRIALILGFESDKPFWSRFHAQAGEAIRKLDPGSTILDLGGGRRCLYAAAIPETTPMRLVAVDISASELALNREVTETCVADVSFALPFPDASVDLILSRTLLEHVDDVAASAGNMARVLRPGGTALHFVPGRFSFFALAARLLPFGPLLKLLHLINSDSRGQVEFKVVYDLCHPAAIETAFRNAGFTAVSVEVCWAQPGYFEPIPPLFVVTSLYETLARRLGIRRLAAYMIVTAVK
jgi:SAM-dependent methyltransferase